MVKIALLFRRASFALLLLVAATSRAQDVTFQTSWFKSGDQPVLRLQAGRWAIVPTSPALHERRLFRVTDAETGRVVPFDIVSNASGTQRLRAIDIRLTDFQLPHRVNVTVSGLILEDREGHRLTSGGRATASVPIADVFPPQLPPQFPRHFHHHGKGGDQGFAGPTDFPADGPPQQTLPADLPKYRGPMTIAAATPAPSATPKPTASPPHIARTTATAPPEVAAEEIPEFPFPPPRASAFEVVPRKLIVGDKEHPLLKDARAALSFAFDECGYGEKSYYAVPDGFALASRIEQMKGDGTPSDDRWSLEVKPITSPSLKSYLQALFHARPGRYRVIVFVLTNHWFDQKDVKVSSDEASSWVSKGANELPPEIGEREYTDEHACTAMIYEFRCLAGQKPQFVEPSEITGHMHLERSGFLAALARAKTR